MSAALAAALLCLAASVGSVAASEWHATLRDPLVSPRTGTPATVVRFSVTFAGHGTRDDARVSVVIDGTARSMTPTSDANGGSGSGWRFAFSSSLPVGLHVIVFAGQDVSGSASLGAGLVRIHDASDGDGSTGPGSGDTPAGGAPGGDGAGAPSAGAGPTATPAPTASPAPEATASAGSATPTPMPVATPTTAPGDGGAGAQPTDAPVGTIPPAGAGRGPDPSDGAGPPAGSSTGGDQATRPDAPGAADHTTQGSGGGPAPGGSPTGAPPTMGPVDEADVPTVAPSPGPSSDAVALGPVAPPGVGGPDAAAPGGVGGEPSAGGPADDPVPGLLGRPGEIPPTTRMLIVAISSTTTATAIMAFFLFGKRRRDGEPPEPDEVLASKAATFAVAPAAALVGDPMGGPRTTDEAAIPRWRRPSLLEARKADPLRSTAVHDALSFNHGAVVADANAVRRLIRYRNVTLLDCPDELRAADIGYLDEGDEVQLLERSGGYWLVLCPNGVRGWVHRMVLGDVVADVGRGGGFNAARRSFAGRPVSDEATGPTDETADTAEPEPDRSTTEDGTDLLSEYIRRRHA